MQVFIEMVNASTGEIYYNREIGYAFNIGLSNDVGMKKLNEIIESVIRGTRIKNEPLQLRLMFHEVKNDSIPLPFPDVNEFKSPYEVKPY